MSHRPLSDIDVDIAAIRSVANWEQGTCHNATMTLVTRRHNEVWNIQYFVKRETWSFQGYHRNQEECVHTTVIVTFIDSGWQWLPYYTGWLISLFAWLFTNTYAVFIFFWLEIIGSIVALALFSINASDQAKREAQWWWYATSVTIAITIFARACYVLHSWYIGR